MLIVQKFHSIHEIDPEFIPNIETLLQEDISSFKSLTEMHDNAPEGHVFTFFLFFGPTQNSPIGLAQLCLKPIPKNFVPWYRKLIFWNRSYLHWKSATWMVGDGSSGFYVFDPRFARSGKEKIQEIIREYELRDDIKAQEVYLLKGLQEFNLSKIPLNKWTKEYFVLEPLPKAHKSYKNYLAALSPDVQEGIKNSWQELHQKHQIELGDYALLEAPPSLPVPQDQLEIWKKHASRILTFEKNSKILGCILLIIGKDGNMFFEPFPFETEENAIVSDDIYTQYSLIKFFEMSDSRKCHLMKFSAKLIFDEKDDLKFFQEQSFGFKTIFRKYESELKKLSAPL